MATFELDSGAGDDPKATLTELNYASVPIQSTDLSTVVLGQ